MVEAEQAIPYLRFAQPFSKHALAMIVVDHQDPIVNGFGPDVKEQLNQSSFQHA